MWGKEVKICTHYMSTNSWLSGMAVNPSNPCTKSNGTFESCHPTHVFQDLNFILKPKVSLSHIDNWTICHGVVRHLTVNHPYISTQALLKAILEARYRCNKHSYT